MDPRPSRIAVRTLRVALAAALLTVAVVAGQARAQFLADTMVATAIASQTYPSVRFPRGTLRAADAPESLIARVPGAERWTEWEAFTARGLGAALVPAHVRNLTNAFAVAGFFQASSEERTVGDEIHTRTEFEGPGGSRALLYVMRRGSDVAWLVARSK